MTFYLSLACNGKVPGSHRLPNGSHSCPHLKNSDRLSRQAIKLRRKKMNVRKYCYLLAGFFILAFFINVSVFAQATTADITGTVVDQAGAVVAGANVTVTNTGTGLERQTVTTGTGDYSIALLPPGDYEVKVGAAGFSTVVQKVSLVIGQRQTLNISLRPGAVTEVITVSAEVPLVDTTKS